MSIEMSHHCFASLFESYKSFLYSCIQLRQQKLVPPSLYLNTHPDILIQPAPVNLQVSAVQVVLIVLWCETT